eukprot:2783405-Heterocapsa_arctica.AAC.1
MPEPWWLRRSSVAASMCSSFLAAERLARSLRCQAGSEDVVVAILVQRRQLWRGGGENLGWAQYAQLPLWANP